MSSPTTSKDERDEPSRESEGMNLPFSTAQITEPCPQDQSALQEASKPQSQAPAKSKKRKNHRGGASSKEKKINRLFDHTSHMICPSCADSSLSWSCASCDRTLPGGNWASINLAAEDSPTSLFGRVRFLTSVGLRSGKTATMAETIYSGVKTLVKMHSALRGMQESGDAEQRAFVGTMEKQTWIPFVAGWTWAEHDLAGEDREDSVMGMVKTLYEAGALSREEAKGWWDEGRDVIEAWKLINAELEPERLMKTVSTVAGEMLTEMIADDIASPEAGTVVEEVPNQQFPVPDMDEANLLSRKSESKAPKQLGRRRKRRQQTERSHVEILPGSTVSTRRTTEDESDSPADTIIPNSATTEDEAVVRAANLASEPKSTDDSPIDLNTITITALEEPILAVETSQEVSSLLPSLDTKPEKPLSDGSSNPPATLICSKPPAEQSPDTVNDSDEEVIVFKPRGRRWV